jgi:phosphoheptose isomerase
LVLPILSQHFAQLYYRTQELTRKEKILLAGCGESIFDAQPLKGPVVSKNLRYR